MILLEQMGEVSSCLKFSLRRTFFTLPLAELFALEKPFVWRRPAILQPRCQQTARESARPGCSSQVHLGLDPSWMC